MIMKCGRFAAFCLTAYLLMMFLTTPAFAGPPFLTDDPEPVEYHHSEFYIFSILDRAGSGSPLDPRAYAVELPGFEYNYGAAPNMHLHIIAPMALSALSPGPITYGVGDIELGVKYRFIQETARRPQIGVFPLLQVPSGDSSRNLGNGQTWAQLPLWLQKSWGTWTSYGGAGYVINHAPGMRDHIYGGWQAQRALNKKLTLGAEWFNPGRASVAEHGTHLFNAGGIYNFNENFSLLFTAGHSFHGDSHTVAYFGLYWTWGPKDKGSANNSSFARTMSSLHGSGLGI